MYCWLTLDAMKIKKVWEWSPSDHTIIGNVELGFEVPNDVQPKNELATECLVFLVQAINGRFKLPVAYFLMNW